MKFSRRAQTENSLRTLTLIKEEKVLSTFVDTSTLVDTGTLL